VTSRLAEGRAFQAMQIEAIKADITTLNTEVIVNAANNSLLGGGGVDGAIHTAAGPGLLRECSALGGCPTGEARLTAGHDLQARYVIHAVGPVWHGGTENEAEQLASCYRNCMRLAAEKEVSSIAFPAISTGIFGYPADQAAAIAVREVLAVDDTANNTFTRIIFCCFNNEALQIYRTLLQVPL
jgi:O-acetyl-ADP-ribose deacetylase (regulator of RNase III)